MFQKVVDIFEKTSFKASRVLIQGSLASLLVMMSLTAVDVCCRYILNRPIRGAFEITEFLLVITVAALGDPDGGKFHVLHPYATGYSKMTAVWLSAFDNLCNMVYLPVMSSSYQGSW